MNKNVIEILSVLIKKMLSEQDLWSNQDDIIVELEDQGYTIENISEAFDIMFSEIISVSDNNFYMDEQMQSGYNRVFTKVESFYFNKEIKSLIYKLNNLELLTADELELIINRMIQTATIDELKPDLIWEIINDVVEDADIIYMISAELNEFDSSILKYQRVN